MGHSTHAAASGATQDAIGWLVLLRSGEATAADRRAFDDWLHRDTEHRHAWQRLAGPVDGAFAAARSVAQRAPGQADAIANALAHASTLAQRRRRVLRGALALGGVGVATGFIAQRVTPLQDTLADLHTRTGERRSFTLADGSSVLLNARSALDVAFSDTARAVHLRRGACIATVQPDPLRPFSAHCAQGHVQVAAGAAARFLLRQDEGRSLVAALEGPLELAAARGGSTQRLRAGGAAWLGGDDAIAPAPEAAITAPAWQQGLFVVNDQPLGTVIDALRPYRRGLLRIAPEAARLRVHGSYPLDDTDRALAIIGDTLPVQVHVHSAGWLVRIDVA